MLVEDKPPEPDPTYQVTRFLSWLKKRGAIRKLSECTRKWAPEGLDIESVADRFYPELIGVYRYRGEKVVSLNDKVWADRWMIYYDLEVPHHGQRQKQK